MDDDADDTEGEADEGCLLVAVLLNHQTCREAHNQISHEIAVVAYHGEEVRGAELVFHDDAHGRTKVRHESNHGKEGDHYDNRAPLFLFLRHSVNFRNW